MHRGSIYIYGNRGDGSYGQIEVGNQTQNLFTNLNRYLSYFIVYLKLSLGASRK